MFSRYISATLLAIVLVSFSLITLSRPRPPMPEPNPLALNADAGTLFFRQWADPERRIWKFSPAARMTPLPVGVTGEPSHSLHGGRFWFLTVREIPGQSYPDGSPRREIFAVREDGRAVQLTDQPNLEPAPENPRWPVHGRDQLISWIARHWGSDGKVDAGGIFVATLSFDSADSPPAIAEMPRQPLIRMQLLPNTAGTDWLQPPVPDVQNHDWSPDGHAVVYETPASGVFVANLQTGMTTRLVPGLACTPCWSPEGKRIVLRLMNEDFGSIATVHPDGTDLQVVPLCSSQEMVMLTSPIWSPEGRHLAYSRTGDWHADDERANVDVWIAEPDGKARACLTNTTTELLLSVAWR